MVKFIFLLVVLVVNFVEAVDVKIYFDFPTDYTVPAGKNKAHFWYKIKPFEAVAKNSERAYFATAAFVRDDFIGVTCVDFDNLKTYEARLATLVVQVEIDALTAVIAETTPKVKTAWGNIAAKDYMKLSHEYLAAKFFEVLRTPFPANPALRERTTTTNQIRGGRFWKAFCDLYDLGIVGIPAFELYQNDVLLATVYEEPAAGQVSEFIVGKAVPTHIKPILVDTSEEAASTAFTEYLATIAALSTVPPV